jgi:hypothetical protein
MSFRGPHGPKGQMGREEVLLISAHTRRHTLQILELKADPNFPKH